MEEALPGAAQSWNSIPSFTVPPVARSTSISSTPIARK
jgi:hypothetical protein